MPAFNGNYIGADGELHNLDGGAGSGPSESNNWTSPFYGVFVDSDGKERGIEELSSGGGSFEFPGGYTTDDLPEGEQNEYYTDGRANTMIQSAISELTSDSIPEGEENLYFTEEHADAYVEASASIMRISAYAVNGEAGKVDAAITADRLDTAATLSLGGDASGSVSSDLSSAATLPVTLSAVGTSGTYTKVTTDSKGRVTLGSALAATDIPALSLSKITDAGTAAGKDVGSAAGQIPALGADAKLPSSVLPSITVPSSPPTPVSSIDELVALTDALPGGKAILPDASVYMLVADDPTAAENWVELTEDPDTVKSVNGQSGPNVSITTADIAEGENLYFTNSRADSRANAMIAAASVSDLSDGAVLQTAVNANTSKWTAVGALSGLLKATGAEVAAAVPGVDYAPPIRQLSASLTASGWSGSKIIITNAAISAGSIGVILLASAATALAYSAFAEARMHISAQSSGSLTVTAFGIVPTVDVPVVILLLG